MNKNGVSINGMLFIHKKGTINWHIVEPWKDYAEWKITVSEHHILHDSIYEMFWKSKSIKEKSLVVSSGWGWWWGEKGGQLMGMELFWGRGDESVPKNNCGESLTTLNILKNIELYILNR